MKTLNEMIADHPFLTDMKPGYVELLAACSTEADFKAGEIIFREGEPANRFYLIGSGQVALETHRPDRPAIQIQTLTAGDVLGWSWLFPPFVWHFQARALEPTKALAVNGAHLLVMAEKDPAFGYELMKRVTQVLIGRLQSTRRHLFEMQR